MMFQTLPPSTCPECGAPRVEGMTCWEMLGAIIAWEYQDPDLAAEHFLTVASYNLQHPAQFTDEALHWLREGFKEYLEQGTPARALRNRAAHLYQGQKRVLRPEAERHPVYSPWPLTIASVYLPDQPEGAADRVRAWAASIRETF